MKYAKTSSLISTLALIGLMVLGAFGLSNGGDKRPGYLGFEPAWPQGGLITEKQTNLLGNRHDSLRWLVANVDRDGRSIAIEPDTLLDSTMIGFLDRFTSKLKLEPARLHGEKVASKLPLAVRFRPDGLMPLIEWPIDTTGRLRSQELFKKTLRLNGIEPPRIKWFPAYHARVKRRDLVDVYDYVVIKVSLDSAGRPTAIEPVRSTLPGFDQQLVNACNWADWQPAMVDGKPVAAETFVVVSYFPELHYPVPARSEANLDSLTGLHQLRVRTIVDTAGPLAPAIPRFLIEDSLLVKSSGRAAALGGTGLCLIDSSGRARGGRLSTSAYFQPRVSRFVATLDFYPALTSHGVPTQSAGALAFSFTGSGYARIRCLWLPSDNSWLR